MVNKVSNIMRKSNNSTQMFLNKNVNNIVMALTLLFLMIIIYKNVTDHFYVQEPDASSNQNCTYKIYYDGGVCINQQPGTIKKLSDLHEYSKMNVKCTEDGTFLCT